MVEREIDRVGECGCTVIESCDGKFAFYCGREVASEKGIGSNAPYMVERMMREGGGGGEYRGREGRWVGGAWMYLSCTPLPSGSTISCNSSNTHGI